MKEIKFRAYSKKNRKNKWMSVLNIWFNSKGAPAHVFGDVLSGPSQTWFRGDFELMEFTGLKDKKGCEIYEGDIVEKKQAESTFRYDVRFCNGAFGIEFPPPSYSFKPFCELHVSNYEVIGNIYENPELLREGR